MPLESSILCVSMINTLGNTVYHGFAHVSSKFALNEFPFDEYHTDGITNNIGDKT